NPDNVAAPVGGISNPDNVAAPVGGISNPDNVNEERLRHLLAFNDEKHQFTEAEVATLILAIDGLKVLDPAAGSGAFPMGMLYRLVYILSRLDPGNARWKQWQLDKIDRDFGGHFSDETLEAMKFEVEQAFERNELDYARKLFLIQDCIYGIDIQPIAIQIAKLRCFISLIVDQRIDDQRPNKGVRPLPNLETKFVVANSLLGIERPKQLSFRDPEIERKEQKLAEVRQSYFTARTPATKKKYRDQDDTLRAEIGQLLRKEGWAGATAEKLSRWNPYDQNSIAEFFDPEWMFNLTEGFDIVIGNPPYVRQEAIKEQKPLLAKALPEVYAGTADLYVYFYGRGFQLLREGGHLAYISSNKFFRADYGKNLRQFFSSKVKLQTVIDFGDLPVFEATAYPSIIIGAKGVPSPKHELATLSVETLEVVNQLPDFIKANAGQQPQSTLTIEGWNIGEATTQALLAKIKAAGQPLTKYIGGKFYYGIKTGFNEAFVIDSVTRDQLIAQDPKSVEIIKPFLRGKDVKRYKVTYANLYIILAYRGVNISNYPAILNHLSQYETQLRKKAGGGQWYELQASPGDFSRFENQKIVYPDIAPSCRFSYDSSGMYGVNTLYFIPSTDMYLLGLLNATVTEFYYRFLSSQIRGGYLRFFSIYVGQIPISTPKPEQRVKIEGLVNKLIEQGPDAPGATEWQAEIDRVVYEIYGLTDEEIALVEGR
ncbi:MAG: Eco57I restriction-modification methylase domain-containing protein, partial [Chloroflexi bacterium]|nr:Eco57I restriction-modification methylase domain-containing protein [Chloroflexota bacterium]